MDLDRSHQKTPQGRWSRRLRLGRTLLLALSVVAATSVSGHALDVCMDYSNGGSWVLKRLKVPSKNKCVPMQGFENVQSNGAAMTGMACTNVAGTLMTMNYTSHNLGYPSYTETATCKVPLPIGTAGAYCLGTWLVSPGDYTNQFGQDIDLRYCSVDLVY